MVRSFDYARVARMVDRKMKRFGMSEDSNSPVKFYLRRDGADRACNAIEASYSPRDIQSGLGEVGDRRMLVSSVDVDEPPDKEVDVVVLIDDEGEEVILIIVAAPAQTAPNGTVILWDMQCRSK